MTLNGVMAFILRCFTEFGIGSGAHCVKVVEYVVVKKFTFAISSPDEFVAFIGSSPSGDLIDLLDWNSGVSSIRPYVRPQKVFFSVSM